MIPGSNLLNIALTAIGRQSFDYYAFSSRTPNAQGIDVTAYKLPVTLSGSVQPVPQNLLNQYGLDTQRSYMTFFVSRDILEVDRDVSGDQFFFNGKVYQCLSITDWFNIDGWVPVLSVRVPDVG